jgi:hypothetical protein
MIDGTAHTQAAGVATRRDLYDTVKASADIYSDHIQRPEFFPRANLEQAVIDFGRDLTVVPDPAPAPPPKSNAIKVFVRNGEAIAPFQTANGKIEVRPAVETESPDLLFDAQTGNVYSGRGDLLAEHLKAEELAGVAQREFALRRLMEMANARTHVLGLPNGDQRYRFHERVQIDTRKTPPEERDEFYALFDLAATGEVQFLAPQGGNPPVLPKDRAISNMQVVPPYGADTVVLIASPRPLDALLVQLRALDQKREGLAAVEAIEAALAPDVTVGLHQFFSAPGEEAGKN